MKCPKCGKELKQNKKGFGCTGWREGCDFIIWDTVAGYKLTDEDKEKLVNGEETKLITSFISKSKKKFSARLKLNNDYKVEFVFPEKVKPIMKPDMKCPKCGKPMMKSSKSYKCSECDFIIWEHISGCDLTENDIKDIITTGSSCELKFISRTGKDFSAKLVLDEDNNIKFEFSK